MVIKYFSWLKNITEKEKEIINSKKIKDINDLKKYLIIKYPKMKKHLKNKSIVRVAINYEYILSNKKINPTDEIALFPPVSGG